MGAERERFREVLLSYNEDDAYERGLVFIPVGWEQTLGGIGRPQAKINEQVVECDYLVLVLWDRWGSAPSVGGPHTSGAEEEYELARTCLADPARPMKDILVLFKGIDERQLSDPGGQLSKVLAFKKQLEESKQILFARFDTMEEFERALRRHLLGWIRERDQKSPKGAPSSLNDLPDVATKLISTDEAQELDRAERLAQEGHVSEAEALFAAIVTNRPTVLALSRYAKFLRRRGRISYSRSVSQQLLDLSRKLGDRGGEIDAWVNLGILSRKGGDLDKSADELREAARMASGRGEERPDSRLPYVLDNLGHTLRRLGRQDAALEAHRAALAAREDLGDTEDLGYTYNNLGALFRRYGHLEQAITHVAKALEFFKQADDRGGAASALANLGLTYESQDRRKEAREAFEKSYQLNQELANAAGLSMNYGQLARVYIWAGDAERARKFAELCLSSSQESGNQEGIGTGLQHLSKVAFASGQFEDALDNARLSIETFERIPHPLGIAGALADLGRTLAELDRDDEAIEVLERAAAIAKELHEVPLLGEIDDLLGGVRRRLGDDPAT